MHPADSEASLAVEACSAPSITIRAPLGCRRRVCHLVCGPGQLYQFMKRAALTLQRTPLTQPDWMA
jgi:hypothetical protein